VGRWTARQVNRNGEQGEDYEHLQAKPLQPAIFPQPINQKKNDRHGKPNYREMIYHQMNVRPVRQSYQPFECCGDSLAFAWISHNRLSMERKRRPLLRVTFGSASASPAFL
jgi:hypothetical protein